MYADSDVSLHSTYIYDDFSTYTYREREREFLQWLACTCVRLRQWTEEKRRRLKENPLSVMGSESSRLGLVYQKRFLFYDHNHYHAYFLFGWQGDRARLREMILQLLSYIHTLQAKKLKTPKIKIKTQNPKKVGCKEPHPSLLPPETSLMQLILSESHGASHASSADRRQK